VLEEQLYNHSLITAEVVETRYQMALGHRRAPPPPMPPPTAAGGQQPLWQRLDQLQVPLLMLYGRNDRGSVAARIPILRQRYPNLDVHVAEGCKHLVQWDAAGDFVGLAGAFFRQEQKSTGGGGDS
jgi:pimeloyl-ACP methyl ester carboxylesterase